MSYARTQFDKKQLNNLLRTKHSEGHSDKRTSRTVQRQLDDEIQQELQESFVEYEYDE